MCRSSARNVSLDRLKVAEPTYVSGESIMRLIALIVAVFAVSPAAAQNWQECSYPDYSFTVSFPADPQIETTTHPVADGRPVQAHVYAVRRDNSVLKVTVAELADTGLEESAVIDHAIKTLSEGGEVKVNIPHRINRVFGRQLSILWADGGRSTVAVFDHNGRLYQIEGRSLSTADDTTADAIRFAQSLIFTGGGSNRSPDEIRAAQGACGGAGQPGAAAAPGATVPGDGRRFEIRCRRQQSLAALVTSLNSGDLPGAQQAYLSLSELQNNNQARFANPNGPFAQAMSQIGQALQSGDLTGAQQALASLPRARGGARQP
jgi:hypothetical protein